MNILELKRKLLPLSGPQGDSGGGGGGGGSTNQTSQTTTTQDLPDWAKPYAQDVLSKGKAITDINQNPYQPYGGQRIAGFTDLQQQAQQGAQNMQPSQQLGMGTNAAVGAGLGGLNVANQATTGGFQNQVGGYMNPYMNQILAPQLAEANRNYDIGAVNQQSKATQAGAFGGSREAIMAAENERNRNTGLNQIYGQGLNTAFTNAQNQYTANLGTQLQGYGLMGTAANTLGQLGQNQYTQNMGINALQNQYGGQQQALKQQGLDTAYNDFLTQKNYPYQQLSYMANLVRGTPMGMNQTSQVYQAPPSTAQNLGALGLGAYGLSKLAAKEGGLMDSYSGGGDVTSEYNVRNIAKYMPAKELPGSYQMAQARNDLDAQAALQKQMAENTAIKRAEDASVNSGLGGAFNALPQQTQDGMVRAAGGGILAFANGGTKHYDGEDGSLVTGAGEEGVQEAQTGTRIADPRLQRDINQRVLGISDTLLKRQGYTVKPGDRAKYENEYVNSMTQDLGENPYAPMQAYYDKRLAGLEGMTGKMQGAAALKAIPLILQGGNAMRGFGAAAGSLGASAADIEQAQQVAQDHMMQAKMNLTSLQRNEKLGLRKEARADYASLQNNLIAADKNDILGTTNAGNMLAKLAGANRVSGGAGGAGKPNPTIYSIEKIEARIKEEHPEWTPAQIGKEAVSEFNRQTKVGTSGTTAAVVKETKKSVDDHLAVSQTKFKKFADEQFQGDQNKAKQFLYDQALIGYPPDMYIPKPGSSGGGGTSAPAGGGGGAPELPPGFVRQ